MAKSKEGKRRFKLKIQNKLVLIYCMCGLLPIILVASILISHHRKDLIELAMESEKIELSFVESSLSEDYNTVFKVSEGMFFDDVLEKIAFSNYENIMEVHTDFLDFSARDEYMRYYPKTVQGINYYIDNATMNGNSIFIQVDDSIRNEEWYQKMITRTDGKAIWRYVYNDYKKEYYLTLSRLIRTADRKQVGIVNVQIRNSKILADMGKREVLTCLVLDDSVVVAANKSVQEEEILHLCQEYQGQEGIFQTEYNGERYMLTMIQIPFDSATNSTVLLSLHSYKDIMSETDQKVREIWVYIGISIISAFIMISVFSTRYGKRINTFRVEMSKAANGDFKIAERVSGNDEIAELYENLYVMIESIEHLLNVVYEEKIHKEQLNSRQKEVEFKMLANQINPHFLYNTLETIRMKARAAGNTDVEELVKMLSKLMRRNIEVSATQVSLKSELQLVEYYLKIQKYRFEERIQFKIDIQCNIENYQILPLLIQPLVENAFVHGLEGLKGGGEIRVIINKSDKLRIYVRDNGMGMSEEKLAMIRKGLEEGQTVDSHHIGISNVNQRIKLMYGEEYGLIINSEKGKGTEVIIEIPTGEKGKEKELTACID